MISTCGFFADIPCPYLKAEKDAKCERPFCHFSHDENISNGQTKRLSVVLDVKKKATSLAYEVGESSSKVTYKPTPISELRKDAAKNAEPSKATYKPTPIAELNKRLKSETVDEDIVTKKLKSLQDKKKEVPKVVEVPKTEPAKVKNVVTIDDDDDPFDKESSDEIIEEVKSNESGVIFGGKKRIAHDPSISGSSSMSLRKPKPSPKEVMLSRYQKGSSTLTTSSSSSSGDVIRGKVRIAHSVTIPSTSDSEKPIKKPKYPLDYLTSGNKIPLFVRQPYLAKVVEECLKLSPEDEGKAYGRALTEEKSVFDRSKDRRMYSNIGVQTIVRLRNEFKAMTGATNPQPSAAPPTSPNKTVSHQAILNGPQAKNLSIIKKDKLSKLDDVPIQVIYSSLEKYIMSADNQKVYGYPQADSKKEGQAILPAAHNVLNDFKSDKRICFRCKKSFMVNLPTGRPVKKETCTHHWGRIWTQRSHGSVIKIYSCCEQEESAGPCSTTDCHVVDGSGHPDYLKGFVKTTRNNRKFPGRTCPGVFGLDCEMCYTTIGLELTRVTLVNHRMEVLIDELIKPDNPILDYNTKFSGITESDLKTVEMTLKDVQQKMVKILDERSIIVGHSLDSDLKALKMIHPTVIDTSEIYPHRKGLPFRRALKTIVQDELHEIIQNGENGHDSVEDAKSALKVILLSKALHEINKKKSKELDKATVTRIHTTTPLVS